MTIAEKRYALDPAFRALVDTLQGVLAEGMTPYDITQALLVADTRHHKDRFRQWLDDDPALRHLSGRV